MPHEITPPWPWAPSPTWVGRILALNFDPLAFAHAGHWRQFVDPVLAVKLRSQPRVRAHFLHWLRERLGLSEDYCYDFAEPARRFVLLETADLRRLLRLAALALAAPVLRRLVRPAERAQLQAQLGDEAWHFVLQRAPLYHWPEKLPRPEISFANLAHDMSAAEDRLLCAATHDYPAPLARRLQLRFPPAEHRAEATSAASPEEHAAACHLLATLAPREIDPELQLCFA
jgi:hypothetical protein